VEYAALLHTKHNILT